MKSMENQAKHHRSLWSSEDLILQTNNTMEHQAKNHRSLWSSEDLILQTNNRVQTPWQNPARSCQMLLDLGPQESMKSIQIHLKSNKIYKSIENQPVLANEREARFLFLRSTRPIGANRSKWEPIEIKD